MRMKLIQRASIATTLLLLVVCAGETRAQFTGTYLDIGDFSQVYVEGGFRSESAAGLPWGLDWPQFLRSAASSHQRAQAFWIGVKDWTDERGENFPWYVGRGGPRTPGIGVTWPIQNKLVSRTEPTEVSVDGALSFKNLAIVEEVDPNLPADRMVDNIHNMRPGVTVHGRFYAYANQFADNFHLHQMEYCNTGNTDDDEEIELPGQTLHDVLFFRIHRYRHPEGPSWVTSGGQVWGKFNMVDIVGDGHKDYNVDFTAIYVWYGWEKDYTRYNSLGGPLWDDTHWSNTAISGDTVGRLGATGFVGRVTLHADASPSNREYIRCTPATYDTCEPGAMGWMDQDETLTTEGSSHQDYYELGILSRENPARGGGGYVRMYPHYAERVIPSAQYWLPLGDASGGKQGGFAPTEAFGPYELGFNECVNVVQAEAIGGLDYDASVQIGRKYKRGGAKDDLVIEYDANHDGVIDRTAWVSPWEVRNNGSEAMTKNQWAMMGRDSLFNEFEFARALWDKSNGMTTYPIPEAPHAPKSFAVYGRPDFIELNWEPQGGGPAITGWEVYRTSRFEDNMLDADGDGMEVDSEGNLITGYEKIASLDAGATSYEDRSANRGSDYFYYLVAVGQPQPDDPTRLNGTPGGAPLRSSRYLTQTYLPTNLKRAPYGTSGTVADARVVPNPVNLGADTSVRFAQEDRVAFFNIPGKCTIKIFTEVGELVHTIEHTDGSGDELWNLTTASRQLLVSGIYIAVIEDLDHGDSATLKFTVLR